MPWQTTFQEVQQDKANRFEVIAPTLLDTKVSIDASVASRACKRFIVFVWDVFACFWVAISLGEAEIDNVNNVLLFAMTDEEVIRFHISVNEVIIVEELESLDHLVRNHERRLDCEFALTEVECIFQTWTKQIHNHGVVVALNAKPVNCRDASCNDENTLAKCLKQE